MPVLRNARHAVDPSRALAFASLARPAVGADLSGAEHHLSVAFAAGGIADVVGARGRAEARASGSGTRSWSRTAAAPAAISPPSTVSSAAPDGYTLLATTSALAVNDTASATRAISTDDLRPVAIVAFSPDVLAVHPSNPAKNLKEFIANGQEKSFTYGSAGVGTGPHIGAEYFFREVAKVKVGARSVHGRRAGGGAPRSAIMSTRSC